VGITRRRGTDRTAADIQTEARRKELERARLARNRALDECRKKIDAERRRASDNPTLNVDYEPRPVGGCLLMVAAALGLVLASLCVLNRVFLLA
jgi:hypothetical protein